jgi:hypothetical protein
MTGTAKTRSSAAAAAVVHRDVIEAAPLPGVNLPIGKIPLRRADRNRRRHRAERRAGSGGLPEPARDRRARERVRQPVSASDVNYRGYTASPLLGTPQGLSVYMDGVRLNQPFGEVVSWDLIPRMAIVDDALMPGSNPLFGLNTLGGRAVDPDQERPQCAGARASRPSTVQTARRAIEFEHGGSGPRASTGSRRQRFAKEAGATTRRHEVGSCSDKLAGCAPPTTWR